MFLETPIFKTWNHINVFNFFMTAIFDWSVSELFQTILQMYIYQ